MRLFLYGTLLHPTVLNRRAGTPGLARQTAPATLPGWLRVGLPPHHRWPTLRRHRGSAVAGLVLQAPAATVGRLAAYEGDAYRLTPVVVATASGKTAARAWIAPGGTRRPWNGR